MAPLVCKWIENGQKQTTYACGKLGVYGRIEIVEASNEVLEVCVHAVVGAEAKNSLTSWLVPCQHEA
ncbi:hypothetical protein IJI94_00045 [Candidatus Saccharibacteria bacterium]|nr:hypothetical protein [Candidatus Saccharibacteria bacterium]